MSTTFDYVIIGGGTAGSVLASRLSTAFPEQAFLVIEAGASGDPRIEPTQGYHQGLDPSIEWDHRSIPQKGLNGKVVDQAQGKIMGGSSAINVQAWTRGPSVDFDQWAAEVNDQRWSWSGLLPYFKRTETFYPPPDQERMDVTVAHGFDGPIKVSFASNSGKPRNYPLRDTIAQAYELIGVPRILDHNSGAVLGFAELAANNYEGKRYWSSNCYKFGNNVTTWVHTLAAKILFDGKRATSVQLIRKAGAGMSARVTVTARKEIILSSGVQGSAKLLLLSGIGPADELQKRQIPQICDLPVGENYSDHPFFQTFWKLRDQGLSLGDAPFISPKCDWTAGIPCDWMAWHKHDDVVETLKSKAVDQASINWLLAEGKPHTETLSLYAHLDMAKAGVSYPGGSCLTLGNVLLSPTSRGTLRLRSADPNDAPVLDPNILGNELDRQLMLSCGRLTMAMMQGPIGQKIGAQEYGIEETIRDDTSDDAMMARLLKTARSVNHGSGTCSMGSVVDTECRVKSVEGLRVVDASVFPFPIGAHYQAIVYAVAEQVAQMIIDEEMR